MSSCARRCVRSPKNLWAVHTNQYDYAADYDGRHEKLTDTTREYRQEFVREYYETEHPVVRVHPVTGERVLFVNPGFTSHVQDVSRVESTAILDLLYAEMTRPEYTVRLRWEPGTVAFWDNYATAHCAPFDIAPDQHARRILHRVTLLGEVPVGTDGQQSEIVDGEPLTSVGKKTQ